MRPGPDDVLAAVEAILVREVQPRLTDAHAAAMLSTVLAALSWLKESWADWAPATRDACLELEQIANELLPRLSAPLQRRVSSLVALGAPDWLNHREATARYETWRQIALDMSGEMIGTADQNDLKHGRRLVEHLIRHACRIRRDIYASGTLA